jgi:hypothetical protein
LVLFIANQLPSNQRFIAGTLRARGRDVIIISVLHRCFI